MPLSQDDFGFGRAPWRSRLKNMGLCRPQPQIGTAIWDTTPEREPRVRGSDAARSQLDSKFYPKEAISSRPLKRPKTPPNRVDKVEGIARIDHIPMKQRALHDTSKRCFPWARSQLTGYENPVQWEEEPIPGQRPSHPVSANGPVGVEHRRCFPEKQLPSGIPPPALCKPPFGSEWGGWALNGAPGRGPLQQPWDSLRGANEEREERFCDARTKRFPEMKYEDTFHRTKWHLDAKDHVDPANAKRIHVNVPKVGLATPAAGKASNMPVEGAAMDWYERVRGKETSQGSLGCAAA
ncbi:Uncharacterized protein (Fragment), partial [Durusdinium trenchii]